MKSKFEIPKVYSIEGKNMIQLPSTPKSGLFKFRCLKEGEIYLYEKNEIPKHYLKLLTPLP